MVMVMMAKSRVKVRRIGAWYGVDVAKDGASYRFGDEVDFTWRRSCGRARYFLDLPKILISAADADLHGHFMLQYRVIDLRPI